MNTMRDTPRPIHSGPHPEVTITIELKNMTQEHLRVLRLSLVGMAQVNVEAQDLLAAIDAASRTWRS